MPVSSIEGPVVLHKNGDVVQYSETNSYRKVSEDNPILKILWVGDISFGYGEFAENNHVLLPSGYVEEWWSLELEKALKENEYDGELKNATDNFQKLNLKKISENEIKLFIENPFENYPSGEQSIELSKKLKLPLHPKYTHHYGNVNGSLPHSLNGWGVCLG